MAEPKDYWQAAVSHSSLVFLGQIGNKVAIVKKNKLKKTETLDLG